MKNHNELRRTKRHHLTNDSSSFAVTREPKDDLTPKIHSIKTVKHTTLSSNLLSFKWMASTKSATSELFTKIDDWSKARFDPKGVKGMQKGRVSVEATSSLGGSSAALQTMSNQGSNSDSSYFEVETIEISTDTDSQGRSPYDHMVHDEKNLCRDGKSRNNCRSVDNNENGHCRRCTDKGGNGGGLTLSEDINIYHEEGRWNQIGECPVFSGWNAFCGMHTRPRTVSPTYWDDLIAARRANQLKLITESLLDEKVLEFETQKGPEKGQRRKRVYEDTAKSPNPESLANLEQNARPWTLKRISAPLSGSPSHRNSSSYTSSSSSDANGNATSGSSRAASTSNESSKDDLESGTITPFVRSKKFRVVGRRNRYPFSR